MSAGALTIEPLGAGAACELAALHASSFAAPWRTGEFAALLTRPGIGGMGAARGGPLAGFILWRIAGREAEILTLAVDPAHRRQGLARALLGAATGLAGLAGATSLFLEVAEDNAAARALYREAGFAQVARRRGYYRREEHRGAGRMDALVLRCDLAPLAASRQR